MPHAAAHVLLARLEVEIASDAVNLVGLAGGPSVPPLPAQAKLALTWVLYGDLSFEKRTSR
jgi:hypothetical protein